VNIGTDELISVNGLVSLLSDIAVKEIKTNHIEGPVGVLGRYETFDKISALGWAPKFSMEQGMEKTYKWIEEQVKNRSVCL